LRSLFEKAVFVNSLFAEKRDSCVIKLKVPIVLESDFKNKIKQLKDAASAR